MKKFLKSVLLICFALCFTAVSAEKVPVDKNIFELVKDMKTGWNLGNSFDANGNIDLFQAQNGGVSSITSWGVPAATEKTMKTLADAGFKTIRIPVSWSNHIVDNNYKIDPEWMAKVKEAVDWAIKYDLYVIINIHHDNYYSPDSLKYGRGYYPLEKCYPESEKFVVRMWEQIGKEFKNYDGHLVFEALNEPRLRGNEHEWNFVSGCPECEEAMRCINKLNQKAVDTIRATGGNNSKRLIMVPSYVAAPWAALDKSFKIPNDKEKRICLSAHAYSPYPFAMQKNKEGGTSKFTPNHKKELMDMFSELNKKFVSKGVPVIMGEYGATNKHNDKDRLKWFDAYLSSAKKYGILCVLWDNNAPNNKDESERFGYLNRATNEWYFPDLIKKIMEVTK